MTSFRRTGLFEAFQMTPDAAKQGDSWPTWLRESASSGHIFEADDKQKIAAGLVKQNTAPGKPPEAEDGVVFAIAAEAGVQVVFPGDFVVIEHGGSWLRVVTHDQFHVEFEPAS